MTGNDEHIEIAQSEAEGDDFLSNLLKPGSSLNPTFLLILDAAFATLLAIFLALLYLTSGSIHFVVLLFITLCFWGSVKWFVNELKTVKVQQTGAGGANTKKEE